MQLSSAFNYEKLLPPVLSKPKGYFILMFSTGFLYPATGFLVAN